MNDPLRRRRPLSTLAAAALLTVSLALAACGKSAPHFTNLDITDNKGFASDFALPDTDGKLRHLSDFRGKAVVLFFGYTHCPDVCPTTMAELAQAKKALGEEGSKVQVLFVTVDPARDTPAVLKQYVGAFDPSIIGLVPPTEAELDAVKKGFHIYSAKSADAASASQADYTVDHTAASFVFDPQGKLRLFARDGQGADTWVHDLKLLLE